jgi:hypothetical protein
MAQTAAPQQYLAPAEREASGHRVNDRAKAEPDGERAENHQDDNHEDEVTDDVSRRHCSISSQCGAAVLKAAEGAVFAVASERGS